VKVMETCGSFADIRARTGPGLYRQLSTIAVTMVDGSRRQTTFGELGRFN
jgi:hypothetical protein